MTALELFDPQTSYTMVEWTATQVAQSVGYFQHIEHLLQTPIVYENLDGTGPICPSSVAVHIGSAALHYRLPQ